MAENGKTDSTNEEDKPGVPDEGTLANMGAAEWADVLADHPELAGKCDWTKFSLLEVAGILARQPVAAAAAKKSRGIRGGILAITVGIERALNDSMELCRKVLKPGAVPRHPRADETRNAPKWISYSVAEPGQVTLSAALDGETVFSRNLDLSRMQYFGSYQSILLRMRIRKALGKDEKLCLNAILRNLNCLSTNFMMRWQRICPNMEVTVFLS